MIKLCLVKKCFLIEDMCHFSTSTFMKLQCYSLGTHISNKLCQILATKNRHSVNIIVHREIIDGFHTEVGGVTTNQHM